MLDDWRLAMTASQKVMANSALPLSLQLKWLHVIKTTCSNRQIFYKVKSNSSRQEADLGDKGRAQI